MAVERRSRLRIYVLVGIFSLILCALIVRLFDIQILRHHLLSELAERQYQKTAEIRGKRGTIYDRRGRELALSTDRESIYLNPLEFRGNSGGVTRLAQALNLNEGRITERVASQRQFVWLKRHASSEEAAAVRNLSLKGVGFVSESQRVYPKGDLAGQAIGFVGTDDNGLEGVEHGYESVMAGEAVRLVLDRDARGRSISLRADTLGQLPQGQDLVLTIDERIQFFAERELRAHIAHWGAKGGVALVMDPLSGEILALANETRFDPANFREATPKTWRERNITDTFEPGSTLKALVAAAALEERTARPDDMFFGEHGSIQVASVSIRDHEKFGWLTFREVIERSSNVGAIKIGKQLGNERLYTYLTRFGIGSRTGIDFPGESPGLLRPPKQWSEVSLASLAMGQEVAVTPLQLATAFSALANGGTLVRPYLVKSVFKGGEVVQETAPVHIRRVIAEATARQVTAILQGVVTRGTGKSAAVEGYAVAGKTGTAQKYDAALGRYAPQRHVASFVGYLPAGQPRATIVVSIDEPQGDMAWGGAVAAPVFSAIAGPVMRYLQIPPEHSQARVADIPARRSTLPSDGTAMVTLSAGNFVENVREMARDMVEQMTTYVWGHFFTVDVKDTRKPRKKAEKHDH